MTRYLVLALVLGLGAWSIARAGGVDCPEAVTWPEAFRDVGAMLVFGLVALLFPK